MKPKLILFFVAAGIATEEDKAAAAAIAQATGERVVFRNSTVARQTGENPEPCLGVAGDVPDDYAAKFDTYSTDGTASAAAVVDTAPGELNALGLPVGSPEDRAGLKEALEAAGIEFHPNAPTAKLADLFRENLV